MDISKLRKSLSKFELANAQKEQRRHDLMLLIKDLTEKIRGEIPSSLHEKYDNTVITNLSCFLLALDIESELSLELDLKLEELGTLNRSHADGFTLKDLWRASELEALQKAINESVRNSFY